MLYPLGRADPPQEDEGMGDNTEMGTLAVTEELQEAARKEAAARKAPQDAAADAKGAGEPASKKGFGRPEQSSSRSGGPACRPDDGTRWDTGTRRRRPAAQAGAAEGSAKSPNSPCRAPAARCGRWYGPL